MFFDSGLAIVFYWLEENVLLLTGGWGASSNILIAHDGLSLEQIAILKSAGRLPNIGTLIYLGTV